jgi:hypothetical protein
MPDTRSGIYYSEEGICSVCLAYENKKVDYQKRYEGLNQLCNKYGGMNGENRCDCMIAVSGEKDSHLQVIGLL